MCLVIHELASLPSLPTLLQCSSVFVCLFYQIYLSIFFSQQVKYFYPRLVVILSCTFPSTELRAFEAFTHLNLHLQEIDTIHSLKLSKIIRLNTGFKSSPENVFFSTDYCSSVNDFQCVPHNESETGSCEDMQRTLWTLRQELLKHKKGCDKKSSVTDASTSSNDINTALIVMCVGVFLVAVLLFVLFLRVWLQLRRTQEAKVEKDAGYELKFNPQKDIDIYQNSTTI